MNSYETDLLLLKMLLLGFCVENSFFFFVLFFEQERIVQDNVLFISATICCELNSNCKLE